MISFRTESFHGDVEFDVHFEEEIEEKAVNIYIKIGSDGKLFGHVTTKQIVEEFEIQTGIKYNKSKFSHSILSLNFSSFQKKYLQHIFYLVAAVSNKAATVPYFHPFYMIRCC